MTVDAYNRDSKLILQGTNLSYKEKERKGRCGEMDEKIMRKEYTLDRSQSKVFLVLLW